MENAFIKDIICGKLVRANSMFGSEVDKLSKISIKLSNVAE